MGDTGDSSSVLELGRFLGEEPGNPLQFSYPENPMDRGPWRATIHRVAESQARLKPLITQSQILINNKR